MSRLKEIWGIGVFCLILIILTGTSATAWADDHVAPQTYHFNQQPDITELKFSDKSTSSLHGKWQFFPQRFLSGPDESALSRIVELPASFKTLTGSNATYGTFIAHFKIPKNMSDAVWVSRFRVNTGPIPFI